MILRVKIILKLLDLDGDDEEEDSDDEQMSRKTPRGSTTMTYDLILGINKVNYWAR